MSKPVTQQQFTDKALSIAREYERTIGVVDFDAVEDDLLIFYDLDEEEYEDKGWRDDIEAALLEAGLIEEM